MCEPLKPHCPNRRQAFCANCEPCGVADKFELVGYTAGLAIGAEGLPAIGAMGLERLTQAPRFELLESRAVGVDVMHRWGRRL